MAISRTKPISIAQAAVLILSCCLALQAFPQQASQPNKGLGPTSSPSTLQTKASADSQSKVVENDGVYQVGGLVLPPKVIQAPSPKYTYAAKRARLEGDCILSLVVDANGEPQNIRVKKPLGKGLDKSAMKAVKRYRFKAATLNGKPVPVEINIVVQFHIY